ncbi:MAG: MurR/RpiR family transcriptional regulator [Deltaproteobacteria bacterium]|nr:MurR/RpiR family transcriptional regulator [Deltaproteobacteria bacterium]
MPINALLADKRIELTDAQKRAAQYIMDHYEESIFLTASKLARKAAVSEATIVRLAQVLGFDGYPKLQEMLRTQLQDRLTTVTRLEETVKHNRTDGDNLSRIMQEDIRNLSETLRDIPLETFHQAVTDMKNAKRIFVVGLRGAHGASVVLTLYLRFLGKQATPVIPGYGDVWNTLDGVCADDLAIGISLPRYTKLTIDILEYVHENGARVGAITDSLVSPLARNADWVLPVHSRLDSFIESFTAVISLINALLTELSVQNPEETMKALKERELLWQKKEIYVLPYADYKKVRKKRITPAR